MNSANLLRALLLTSLALAASAGHADSTISKASDWLGHAVVTSDGKSLGTVRDFAIDERSGKIIYLVVSVGSFLIENNLIAVAPDALDRSSTDADVLRLEADPSTLPNAKRFAHDGHWPSAPDVVRAADIAAAKPPAASTSEQAPDALLQTGTATIESGTKTAHLSANDRVIIQTAPSAPATPASPAAPKTAASPRPPPITEFERLDKDGDGVLNRSEFAAVITPKDRYSKIDTNADGVIEPQEFDAYEQQHVNSN